MTSPGPQLAGSLIGRDHPAGLLRAEIDRALASHGGLVLVTGEAGIGKTTLVTDGVAAARRGGALVLNGSCWDSGSAPGYWPWVQVIRGLRRAATPAEWAAAAEAAGTDLAVLLGEGPRTGGPDADRLLRNLRDNDRDEGFPLYDAVTTALVTVAQHRPVVVVLDDLHWADPASVRLLEFATRHTWFERLLLVGTYRDAEVEAAAHPLRPLILPLLARATTITLTGLDPDGVGRLIERTTGVAPAPELAAEVHRRTGGNPFFVEQTARLWRGAPTGAATMETAGAIAPGVREAVQRRLSLLPPPVSEALTTAAVLGREFHRQVLAATMTEPVPQVDRLLDEAATARLVVVLGGGRFTFVHDLVRETLYDSLDEAAVRERHAAVIRAVDHSPAVGGQLVAADLARHAYLAAAEVGRERAREALLAAARDANTRMSDEEAIGHLRRALELTDDDSQRATLGLRLGQELFHLGHREEAAQRFDAAVAAARRADPEILARVAIALYRHRDGFRPGGPPDRIDLLREAYERMAGAPAEPTTPGEELLQDLISRTSALARSGNDDEALAFSLAARHDTIWGPGTAREREALTREMEELARRAGDADTEQYASSLRWVALLEQGEPAYLAQFQEFVALTERLRTPRFQLGAVIDTAIIDTVAGRFAEAEAGLARLLQAEHHDHPDWSFMYLHLRWALLLRQGRFDEAAAMLTDLGEAEHPQHGLLAAITAVETGDVATAVRHLAQAPHYPRPFVSLWLKFQAEVAAVTRDPQLVERVRATLAPHAGEWAVAIYGCEIAGPMDLWLGLLDAAQDRWDDAVARLTSAYRSADRMHARSWSVEIKAHLARALLARAGPDDAAEAAALLSTVEKEAAAIDLRHPTDRLAGLWDRSARPSTVVTLVGDEFRPAGDVWTISYAGRSVHLPDAKGLHDLAFLLGRPGVDVPAVQLLNPAGGEVVAAARALGGDPVLDATAKAAYKKRLEQLDEEIDRAAARGDDARAARLDTERQALLDELRAAAGLAGRSRRLGDEAERARKTVTARIRDTLRRLDERHPELAEHLRASVTTGATCRYQPVAPVAWKL